MKKALATSPQCTSRAVHKLKSMNSPIVCTTMEHDKSNAESCLRSELSHAPSFEHVRALWVACRAEAQDASRVVELANVLQHFDRQAQLEHDAFVAHDKDRDKVGLRRILLQIIRRSKPVQKSPKLHRFQEDQLRYLHTWYNAHVGFPYPSAAEKRTLCAQSGLNRVQLDTWLVNTRRRKAGALEISNSISCNLSHLIMSRHK